MPEAARASRRARLLLRGEDGDEEEEFHGEALCMSDPLALRGRLPRSDHRLALVQRTAVWDGETSIEPPEKEWRNRSRLSARVCVGYIGRARELGLGIGRGRWPPGSLMVKAIVERGNRDLRARAAGKLCTKQTYVDWPTIYR
jgi:hypothetical protein